MTNRLLIYSLSIVLILIHNFVPLVYGQSGCENADWGSPLEHDLNVRDPFNPPHYGTDYSAADGDNVRTVADGTILTIDYKEKQRPNRLGLQVSGWGKYVVVRHADGSTTLYAHLQEDSANHLYEGMPVTKGSIIGKADSTPYGGVTGPHLHFEYAPDGRWWDKRSRKDPNPCIVSCTPEDTLTITGSETITRNSSAQYTATGCPSTVEWSVSGSGATISSTGLLTVGSTACGTSTVTATCAGCKTSDTQDVRVTDAGQWVFDYNEAYCGDADRLIGGCFIISNTTAVEYIYGWIYISPCQTTYNGCSLVTPLPQCQLSEYPCWYLLQKSFYTWGC